MTTQFPGESDWDAIISDGALNIEEEESFIAYVKRHGYSKSSALPDLAALIEIWRLETDTGTKKAVN